MEALNTFNFLCILVEQKLKKGIKQIKQINLKFLFILIEQKSKKGLNK